MALESRPLTPRIGSELVATTDDLLSGDHVQQIRDLLEERGVLVVRGLSLNDAQQMAFSKTLGDVFQQGDGGLVKITLDPQKSDFASFLHGTFYWHIDGSQDAVPSRASLLTAKQLADEGGQTEFANMYAAYDDLPSDKKAALDGVRVIHSQVRLQRMSRPDISDEEIAYWEQTSVKSHPLVWTHQSGRKSLVLGMTASAIEGLSPTQGMVLIDELQAWSEQRQFVYQHEWEVGDLLIWDNTGCMHRVLPYAADSGRMMHRTTLVGEEAVA